ncbi:hypothetical protein Ddc_01633 [Ditylenchus destructor]|nr:hypothetical protein Ddc_01633 [Ditylenchus destructor]
MTITNLALLDLSKFLSIVLILVIYVTLPSNCQDASTLAADTLTPQATATDAHDTTSSIPTESVSQSSVIGNHEESSSDSSDTTQTNDLLAATETSAASRPNVDERSLALDTLPSSNGSEFFQTTDATLNALGSAESNATVSEDSPGLISKVKDAVEDFISSSWNTISHWGLAIVGKVKSAVEDGPPPENVTDAIAPKDEIVPEVERLLTASLATNSSNVTVLIEAEVNNGIANVTNEANQSANETNPSS